MTRVQTTNFQADSFTTFFWATDDNDQFNREYDMAFVAQALEHHDHSSGRGLPVARIEASIVDETALASNSVTTPKIANLAVTGAKMAELTIANSKLAGGISADKLVAGVAVANLGYTPLNLAGGTLTGSVAMTGPNTLSLIHSTSIGTTNLYIEKAAGSAGGFPLQIHNKETAPGYCIGALNAAASNWDFIWSHNQLSSTIPIHMNAATGNYIAQMSYGSSAMVTNMNANYLVNQPGAYYGRTTHEAFSGAHVLVPTAGHIPAGWARQTNLDGRTLMGGGITAGIGNNFVENNHYGNWKPGSILSASHSLSVVGGGDASSNNYALAALGGGPGSFNASQLTHTHPGYSLSGGITLNGTTTDWNIAAYTMVMCYKT
jgi:hypothetical protein